MPHAMNDQLAELPQPTQKQIPRRLTSEDAAKCLHPSLGSRRPRRPGMMQRGVMTTIAGSPRAAGHAVREAIKATSPRHKGHVRCRHRPKDSDCNTSPVRLGRALQGGRNLPGELHLCD